MAYARAVLDPEAGASQSVDANCDSIRGRRPDITSMDGNCDSARGWRPDITSMDGNCDFSGGEPLKPRPWMETAAPSRHGTALTKPTQPATEPKARARLSTSGRAAARAATSASVDVCPSENRRAELA